jgi:hypothetical protein
MGDRFGRRRSLGVVLHRRGDATMCDCGSIADVPASSWSSSSTCAEWPGLLASCPLRHAREVLGFCNGPAIDTCIVDNVRGARVTRWCPMNGGERIDDRLVG